MHRFLASIIAAIELVWNILKDAIPIILGLQMKELLNLSGTILLVLIDLELLEKLKGYEMD